jgi:transcriptional regulator with XRE-family HTH domain
MIGWTRDQLSRKSGIGFSTLSDFENGRHVPHPSNMQAIVGAFEAAGIIFLDGDEGPGLRLRRQSDRG